MSGLSFVALDVETANRQRGSICAIGLAVVRCGTITETYSWLCRPPEPLNYFDPYNICVHGIRPQDVIEQPPFRERLSQALDIICDRPVIAHNAAFDISALRHSCDADELMWPSMTYGCTLVWSRRELDLINYRLPLVAGELGIPFRRHHDALEDATACARILLALADRKGSRTVPEFAEATGTSLGAVRPDEWWGCRVVQSSGGSRATARRSAGEPALPTADTDADPGHPLYGQVVVFTGGLAMPRETAWEAVARLGGIPAKGVTKRTTHLVIGSGFTGDDPADFHTGKAAKAQRLRNRGQKIEVLTEEDFESLITDCHISGTSTHHHPTTNTLSTVSSRAC